MLEPCDGKLSSTVLRGERGRKAPDLLGLRKILTTPLIRIIYKVMIRIKEEVL